MQHHNKGRRLPPEPLSKEEALALLKVCSKRAPTGLRDRALIVVMWRGQLRIGEALALKPADFNPESCEIRVLHGKGDKSRVAVIDRQACDVVCMWLERRKSLGFNGHHPLFCVLFGANPGGTLDPSQIRHMLPRRAKKAGIVKRCHPHGLRTTGASELASEGFDLRQIADQLGHGSVAVTDRYIRSVNPAERGEKIRSRSWEYPNMTDPRVREIADLKERLARLEKM
jgi:site-specific recombinase XerD